MFFVAMLLVFSEQLVVQISLKGQLDRLSFSLVSLLRERAQLYDSNETVSSSDADAIYTIAKHSLKRTFDTYQDKNLGVYIEGMTFDENNNNAPHVTHFTRGQYSCRPNKTISGYQDLSVVTSWSRKAPLYRVTLCYKGVNFYGYNYGGDYSAIDSSSFSIGR
nr:tight adherence pilus pseudopilin TadF [Vibrio sinus]